MIKLFCVFVGAQGSAFPVDIDASQFVGDLKYAIVEKKKEDPNLKSVTAKNLQLFQTKTENGDGWLSSDDGAVIAMRTGAIPEQVKKLLKDEMDPAEQIGDKFRNAPTKKTIHVLVVVPPAPENERKRKRMEDEVAPDAWIKAIKDEPVTTLPTCEGLKHHLLRALHVKIPINNRLFQIVSAQNSTGELFTVLEKLFEPQPRNVSDITGAVLRPIIDPLLPSGPTTKSSYHHFWDCVIATLLKVVTDGNYHRSTNASASTGAYRPDMCFYSRKSNICVFRGEEKANGELDVPMAELHEKLTWRYDDAPYIFGYAAVGLLVCLVTIQKDEKTSSRAKAEKIETYDLGNLKDRLLFLLALLNLSTLFDPVVDLIRPLGIPEYITRERTNGVRIEFAEDCVIKTYPKNMPSDGIIRNLKSLHRLMKEHSVPNVVELKNANKKKKHVKLAPIGIDRRPVNVDQLLMALCDILKALVALHAINVMHRDLRWENVLKYSTEGDKWFLIDFDEGRLSPAATVTHLKAESHAPEILSSSSHTVKVDIWSVGYLLKTCCLQDLPPELKRIQSQCLQTDPSSRPTAKSLLAGIESLIES
eukprot:jgi/Phyca11/96357/e_gw1.1.1010.1